MADAQATVDLNADIPAIVTAAGVTYEDTGHDVFHIEGDTLFVKGCSQAALDAAIAAFDVDAHVVAVGLVRLRAERAARLARCDWTQLPDANVNATAWKTYRQALRDLPANTPDPANVAWPDEPTE